MDETNSNTSLDCGFFIYEKFNCEKIRRVHIIFEDA